MAVEWLEPKGLNRPAVTTNGESIPQEFKTDERVMRYLERLKPHPNRVSIIGPLPNSPTSADMIIMGTIQACCMRNDFDFHTPLERPTDLSDEHNFLLDRLEIEASQTLIVLPGVSHSRVVIGKFREAFYRMGRRILFLFLKNGPESLFQKTVKDQMPDFVNQPPSAIISFTSADELTKDLGYALSQIKVLSQPQSGNYNVPRS